MTQKEIFDFVDSQKKAFIGSVDEDGFPNIKAMLAPRERDGVTFYFTTNTSSMRVKQYLSNSKASIYFYHRGRFRYTGVILKGTMNVLTDQETKEERGYGKAILHTSFNEQFGNWSKKKNAKIFAEIDRLWIE